MKTALVTGAGCDIGREVSLFLGAKGYKILAHGTTMKKTLEDTQKKLKRKKIPYSTYLADYTVIDDVVSMCDQILQNEKELGAIIHVAGGSTAFGHDKITPKQVMDSVNSNLVAPMIITHKLIPLLTKNSIIVFTSALSGIHAGWYPTDACFDAAKGGISRFTENMARNLGPRTRVNCIVIGLSYVDDNYKEWREGRTPQMPMGRMAYPKDYVKCVDFFLTHDYITAVSLPLDGGWLACNVNPPLGSALMHKS